MTDFEGDPFALLAKERGAKTFGFLNVGDAVGGVVLGGKVEQDRKYEMRNPGNGALLFWDAEKRGTVTEVAEGNEPVLYTTTYVQAYEATEDDDGRRAIRANKPRMKEAIQKATASAGARIVSVGGFLWVCHNVAIPSRSGGNAAKGFTARYWTPKQVAQGEVPEDLGTVAAVDKKDEDNPFA